MVICITTKGTSKIRVSTQKMVVPLFLTLNLKMKRTMQNLNHLTALKTFKNTNN
jgi:hypothetical protein